MEGGSDRKAAESLNGKHQGVLGRSGGLVVVSGELV